MWCGEYGINTFSYYHKLTSTQKRDIIKRLDELIWFKEIVSDDREKTYVYLSDFYACRGIKIWVSRYKGKSWSLIIVVHPMLVLDDPCRSALYQPVDKKEYRKIVKEVDRLLETVNVPCSVDKMKLCRVDIASTLFCGVGTPLDEYIQILKKSVLLPHYKLGSFREREHKAKDYKRANKHSYKQYCKSAAFFAYDKTAQLEMVDAFPAALIDERTLRLEVQLQQKGMEKWVGRDGMDGSNWSILKKLGEDPEEILLWYLDRLQPAGVYYLCYSDAADMIETKVKGKKNRERMLYLLRKTSDSESLTTALEKLREKYDLSKGQYKTVLNSFHELGISPITLANNSDYDDVFSLSHLLRCLFYE